MPDLKPPRGRAARLRAAGVAMVLAATIAASGCTSTLSNLPVVGEPDHLPKRPDNAGEFPAVHDMPTPRDTKPLTEAERQKLEAELAAARDQQEAATATTPAPKKK
jgi:hypothetical protein